MSRVQKFLCGHTLLWPRSSPGRSDRLFGASCGPAWVSAGPSAAQSFHSEAHSLWLRIVSQSQNEPPLSTCSWWQLLKMGSKHPETSCGKCFRGQVWTFLPCLESQEFRLLTSLTSSFIGGWGPEERNSSAYIRWIRGASCSGPRSLTWR